MRAIPERPRGLTVVELIVVIVVIGVIASFGVPRFMKSVERTKAAEAFQFLDAVRSAQERYRAREGVYAPGLADLELQWRTDAATGEPVLKYFAVKEVKSDGGSWSVRLARAGAPAGYSYDVVFDEAGYDRAGSSIERHPRINPAGAPAAD